MSRRIHNNGIRIRIGGGRRMKCKICQHRMYTDSIGIYWRCEICGIEVKEE